MKNKYLDCERNHKIYAIYTQTDKSAKQIAEQFGLAESTVRNIICKLKKQKEEEETWLANNPAPRSSTKSTRYRNKTNQVDKFIEEFTGSTSTTTTTQRPVREPPRSSRITKPARRTRYASEIDKALEIINR